MYVYQYLSMLFIYYNFGRHDLRIRQQVSSAPIPGKNFLTQFTSNYYIFLRGAKSEGVWDSFRRYLPKKLCCTSTFIEQGDVTWREQTQEWKQYEEKNNAGVGDYHVDYQAEYYNINESD